MAPVFLPHLRVLLRRAAGQVAVSDYLIAQWQNPGDILSILLLLGPDVVQRAIAQLAGRTVTPVAFSLGWVAYAAAALLSSIGDGSLMPDADVGGVMVVGAQSGHHRLSQCWILGRLLRDYNDKVDSSMQGESSHPPPGAQKNDNPPKIAATGIPTAQDAKPAWDALRLTVFAVDKTPPAPHGVPVLDWLWYSGFIVILIQLVISIVPWAIHGHWDTFMVTIAGNAFALAEASLPQWTTEKWSCPKKGGSTVTISHGNGSRNAMVILGEQGHGLDMEILARGTRTARATIFTKISTAALAMLWVLLLITVAGMKQDTWYLFGIGVLGSIQNLVAAGAARDPSALGVHLIQLDEPIRGPSVAKVLRHAEEKYPGVGTSLLSVFFPASMRVKDEDDMEFWKTALQERLKPNAYGTRIDQIVV